MNDILVLSHPILELLKDSGHENILRDFGSPVDEYYQNIDSETQVCCGHTAREAIHELYGNDVELNKKFFLICPLHNAERSSFIIKSSRSN